MPREDRHIEIAERIMRLLKDNASGFKPFGQGDIRYEDPDSRNVSYGIVVTPLGESETTGTNAQDDIGYRFLVRRGIQKSSTNDMAEARAKSQWRIAVRDIFHRKRIGIECELITKVVPGDHTAKRRYEASNFDISAMIVTTWIRENRILNGA